ncbi:MAG: DUF2442 domain-containing protein [Opitutales bacterium]
MTSARTGTATSAPEVTDISPFGVWLLFGQKEYFLPFETFPWFRQAPVQAVFAVQAEGPEHLRWPALDVDLSLEAIQQPEAFPLVYEPETGYARRTEA